MLLLRVPRSRLPILTAVPEAELATSVVLHHRALRTRVLVVEFISLKVLKRTF
jgi:hypothetical protein